MISFRKAQAEDSFIIAQLSQISADGVLDYIWSKFQDEYPSLSPLEIGAKRCADKDNPFGYSNCIFAEENGKVLGQVISFALEKSGDMDENPDPILASYSLEAPGTWYIPSLTVFPEARNKKVGSQLLKQVFKQAKDANKKQVSLLVFEQNEGALRFYKRFGFKEIARKAVVPHELIHHTGDIILLVVDL